jgi:hypothetical protein
MKNYFMIKNIDTQEVVTFFADYKIENKKEGPFDASCKQDSFRNIQYRKNYNVLKLNDIESQDNISRLISAECATVYIDFERYSGPAHIDVTNFADELAFVLHENPQ